MRLTNIKLGIYFKTVSIIYWKKIIISLPIINKYHDYTTYVVLTSPRTGATLLHTYLNNHPNVISLGETVQKSEGVFSLPLLPKCIRALGFKVFYHDMNAAEWASELERLSITPDTKFIWLRRHNTLKQWVSLRAAMKSGKWSATSPVKDENKMTLEPEEFVRFRDRLNDADRFVQRFLMSREHLVINYEDLTKNKEALDRIWKFLNVRRVKVHSLLRQQHPQSLASIVENFADFQMFDVDNMN